MITEIMLCYRGDSWIPHATQSIIMDKKNDQQLEAFFTFFKAKKGINNRHQAHMTTKSQIMLDITKPDVFLLERLRSITKNEHYWIILEKHTQSKARDR